MTENIPAEAVRKLFEPLEEVFLLSGRQGPVTAPFDLVTKLENACQTRRDTGILREIAGRLQALHVRLQRPGAGDRAAAPLPAPARPMRLPCEKCGALHIDEGEFAVKPHHTHTCQRCGLTWRAAIEPTVGVLFLPGYQNYPPPEPLPEWRPHPMGAQQGEGKASVGLGSQAPDAAAVEGEPFFRYVTQSPFALKRASTQNRSRPKF